MVYFAADNNLDRYALGDVEEMEAAGSSEQVTVVALVDRWSQGGGWSTGRLALVQHAPQPGVQSLDPCSTCQDLGEIDSGDPATLRDFVKACAATFPAQRYALILWNHGGGWRELNDFTRGASRGARDSRGLGFIPTPGVRAVCSDDESGNTLYTKEVREALEQSGVRFELLGFDACLMGMVEVAYELKDLARYMIASEQVIPGQGYSYAPFLAELASNPGMDGAKLGEAAVRAYHETYQSEEDCTLALIVPERLSALVRELNNFTKHVAAATQPRRDGKAAWDLRDPLSVVRSDAGPEMGSGQLRLPYVDLGQFLESAAKAEQMPGGIRASANAALQAYRDAVPMGMRAREQRRSGLSVFFPRGLEYEEYEDVSISAYTGENIRFAQECLWPHLVRAFAANEPLPDLGPPDDTAPGTGNADSGSGVPISLDDLFPAQPGP